MTTVTVADHARARADRAAARPGASVLRSSPGAPGGGAGLVAPAPGHGRAERDRHLRVVREPDARRRRITPRAGVALTALVFVTLLAVAGAHALLVQNQIRLDQLESELTTEQERYRALRTEVAELESPARIVEAAQDRLGMVPPPEVVYLSPRDRGIPERPLAGKATAGSDLASDDPAAGSGDWAATKRLLEVAAP